MIFLGNGTDDAAGISGRDNVTGNVPRYDGARTDDDVVADGDAGIDDDVTADPDVRADGHGSGIFEVGITHFSIDGVPCRINTDMRRQKDVVAKGNVMFIQDGKTRIGKEVAAKADAVAMVKVDLMSSGASAKHAFKASKASLSFKSSEALNRRCAAWTRSKLPSSTPKGLYSF